MAELRSFAHFKTSWKYFTIRACRLCTDQKENGSRYYLDSKRICDDFLFAMQKNWVIPNCTVMQSPIVNMVNVCSRVQGMCSFIRWIYHISLNRGGTFWVDGPRDKPWMVLHWKLFQGTNKIWWIITDKQIKWMRNFSS